MRGDPNAGFSASRPAAGPEESVSEVAIACPMSKEADALRAALPDRFLVAATGLGIKRTVPSLLRLFQRQPPSLLLFTGSAGQLDLTLEMGDVVVPAAWRFLDGPGFDCDPASMEKLRALGWPVAELGLTLDQAVLKADKRVALHKSTRAVVYDTVTAAALRVCGTSGVPCLTPKIVASTVQSGLLSFWGNLEKNIRPLAESLLRLTKDLGL